MSKVTREKVISIASQIGIDHLPVDVAASVAPDVEYRLREILQEAIKFMKHGKREKLMVDDINSALKLRNVEILYGYNSSAAPRRYVLAPQAPDVYFADDEVVDFNTLLTMETPPIPRDITFTMHWLAVNGVQPAIPQNPSTRATTKQRKKRSTTEVKPVVQHVLSQELQIYFKSVCEAVKGDDEERRAVALKSVREDPGLNDLLPYFSQFICEEITRNLADLQHLTKILGLTRSILTSEHFFVESYLQQLIPAILTCLVAKTLGSDRRSDHWAVRDEAASLVEMISKTFASSYPTMQPRLAKTFLNTFLDTEKPLTSHYGAFQGMASLGMSVVQLLVLPNIERYVEYLNDQMSSKELKKDADRVFDALVNLVNRYLREARESHEQQFLNAAPKRGGKAKRAKSSTKGRASKRTRRGRNKQKEEEDDEEVEEEEEEAAPAPPVGQQSYQRLVGGLLPDYGSFVEVLQDLFGDRLILDE